MLEFNNSSMMMENFGGHMVDGDDAALPLFQFQNRPLNAKIERVVCTIQVTLIMKKNLYTGNKIQCFPVQHENQCITDCDLGRERMLLDRSDGGIFKYLLEMM